MQSPTNKKYFYLATLRSQITEDFLDGRMKEATTWFRLRCIGFTSKEVMQIIFDLRAIKKAEVEQYHG